ncbi:MAG: NADH-quinone oxidoreductase subunit A [Robiginitomaculum sp.]
MSEYLREYLPIIILLLMGGGFSVVLLLASKIFAPSGPDTEKLSTYECGFNAFEDSRMKFDVRFYLVAILFIIFDLEVAFLFPWAVSLEEIGVYGWAVVMIFLVELGAGLIYAWKKGALDWE